MSLRLIRPQLGQLLIVGIAGDHLPVELSVLAREFGIGGVLLPASGTVDPLQVAELTREVQTLARDVPVWVGLQPDATGAPAFTAWPELEVLARAASRELTIAFATALARERLALGITWECGPVLDLLRPRVPAARRLQALGADAAVVARHATAIVETWRAAGLAACVGHFPGLGSAVADGGDPYPIIDAPPDHLEAVDWVPFRAAIAADVPAIMTSHVLVPSLDERAPATRSRAVVHTALRGHLGFSGVIVTDDLDSAPAAAERETHAAVEALVAGCDVVLQGSGDMDRVAATLEHLVKAAEREDLALTRLDDALRRHEAMKGAYLSDRARRGRPALAGLADVLASSDHARLADRMRGFV